MLYFSKKTKRYKKLLLLLSSIIFIFGCIYLYVFHKPHRDFYSEESVYLLQSEDLMSSFQKDEFMSNKQYNNKVIQVAGVLLDYNKSENYCNLFLDNNIVCKFEVFLEDNLLLIGNEVKIKGRCEGFDSLLNEVTLTHCQIVE